MQLRHHKLETWQRAMALVGNVYRITADLPDSEQFGLISQMRRAAVSVPSNIAEGAARASGKEFQHYLYVSRASLMELETQATIASDLGFIAPASFNQIQKGIESVFAPLAGLIKSLQGKEF